MISRLFIGFIAITCFYFSACNYKNVGQSHTKVMGSSHIIDTVTSTNQQFVGLGVINVYDKNKLPKVIKDYDSLKWGGFYIANPDEAWDGGCSGGQGTLMYVDKKGRKRSKTIRLSPNKKLVSITIDTTLSTYLVVYDRGGIATFRLFDHFKINKDGSLQYLSM